MDNNKLKETLKNIGNILLAIFGCVFFCFTSWIIEILNKEKQNNEINDLKAELKKEEIKNEIKEKTSNDIIADSPDPESIKSGISKQQQEFRDRITDRLKQVLHTSGSEGNN